MADLPAYMRPVDLPDYAHPPVVEVILAVRLQSSLVSSTRQAILATKLFGEELPTMQEQAPLFMPIENLDSAFSNPDIGLQMLDKPPAPRLWFISETGEELLQVQDDFFARNWRLQEGGESYPHYQAIREPFIESLVKWLDGIEEENGVRPKAVQCELTYVNHVSGGGDGVAPHLDEVLLHLDGNPSPLLSHDEGAQVAFRYKMIEAPGAESVGRLYLNAQPALLSRDGEAVVLLTLTARGAPMGEGVEGVVGFLDRGHEWIVRAFDDSTRPAMHSLWGRKNG